jgi:electron transfer flavoprotein beta subunit
MSARTKRLEVIAALDSGQSTRIIKYDVPAQRSTVKIIPANDVGKLVELLHSEAKVI